MLNILSVCYLLHLAARQDAQRVVGFIVAASPPNVVKCWFTGRQKLESLELPSEESVGAILMLSMCAIKILFWDVFLPWRRRL